MKSFKNVLIKDSTTNLLELINEFSKIAEHKGNRVCSFLYTNNEQSEKENTKTITFTIASKRRKSQKKAIKDFITTKPVLQELLKDFKKRKKR